MSALTVSDRKRDKKIFYFVIKQLRLCLYNTGSNFTDLSQLLSALYTNNRISEHSYRNRFLLSIVTVQLIAIMVFRWWPVAEYESSLDLEIPDRTEVLIREIEITRQATSPPPPPKPQHPQPVPEDEIIEIDFDVEIDLDIPDLPDTDPGLGSGSSGEEERVVSNPQIPPTVVRIVEATAPSSVPNEYKGSLEMIVNFLVDRDGEVEEASIMEIRLYSDDGSYEELPFVQYGLMDAVLKAAMQWRFRPARQDGEPVKAFTRQRFNY